MTGLGTHGLTAAVVAHIRQSQLTLAIEEEDHELPNPKQGVTDGQLMTYERGTDPYF